MLQQEVGKRQKRSKNANDNRRDTQKRTNADGLQAEKHPVGEANDRADEGREHISPDAQRFVERISALPKPTCGHLLPPLQSALASTFIGH
jgi:hypothetical protein